MAKPRYLVIGALDGRNGVDPPSALPENQAVEMLNVDRDDGLIGRKRNGASAVTETGGTAFSSGIQTVIRHVPGAVETAAELWGVDGAGTPIVKRMTGGTSFANVTVDDAIATRPQDVVGATLNGKLFLAYDSAVDRLHVYDPNLAAPRVRRVGLATPGAPTAANTGSGSYAATLRYYRVRWVQISGTTLVRRSEAGASVSFTPSGSGEFARVTQPTPPGEGETHWEIELSIDDATFYALYGTYGVETNAPPIAIATTTGDDGTLSADTTSRHLVDSAGVYALPTSAKYLLSDGNRLLMAGAWESGGKNSRLWFTPVLGSLDKGDDERVQNTTTIKNWVDLNENDGGAITGLGGPIYGVTFAFKYRQIWRLNPTGDVFTPYLPRKIADGVYGAIRHQTIAVGRDRAGNPALYFWGPDGPCRIVADHGGGSLNPQYLGRDIEDLTRTINLAATTVTAHGVYHTDKQQMWWWIATGASNDPDTKVVFDVMLGRFIEGDRVRLGWFKHTGDSAGARCSTMMSTTLAASMSRDLKPYIGRSSGTAIWKCDDTSVTADGGAAFQAYVKTKPLAAASPGHRAGMGQSILLAKAASGVTITQTIDRDYGLETRTATCVLTAAASETRVMRQIEGSDMSQAHTLQVQIGDASALSNAWTLDTLTIPVREEDPL